MCLVCKFCGKEFKRECGLAIHERTCKLNPNRKPLENQVCGYAIYQKKNKGNKKDTTIYKCKYCEKECIGKNSLLNHERLCKENPNRDKSYFIEYNQYRKNNNIKGSNQYIKAKKLGLPVPKISEETRKKMSESSKLKKHTEETKRKISESMKIAHENGKAHNIGSCRHNNEPSYPEKWFMKVIENELPIKEYKREFPFYKYALDFAWPELKICIEIDGEQHERFDEYKKRDLEKDELLKKDGWTELRIPWKDCYKNPKYYIELAKSLFINIED